MRFSKIALGAVCLPLLLAQTGADHHGITLANMDRSVKPGDDFNQYANGGWIQRTPIPPDRGRLSVFSTLDDLSNQRTATLIDEAAKGKSPAGSDARKIADLYNSYMD